MTGASPAVEPDPAQDKTALLYDYSKHLLSLALFGLGGIVSLAQSPQGRTIPSSITAVLLASLALSGFLSLSCTATILRARERDLVVGRSAWLSSRFAMLFLGFAVGVFITVWIESLS